jgi:hypothetical protein
MLKSTRSATPTSSTTSITPIRATTPIRDTTQASANTQVSTTTGQILSRRLSELVERRPSLRLPESMRPTPFVRRSAEELEAG